MRIFSVLVAIAWSALGCSSSDSNDASGAPADASAADGGGGGDASSRTIAEGGSNILPLEAGSTLDTVPRTADKLVAPDDTWTWVGLPNTRCADGTPTGVGVNLHPGATKLLVYMEGGGACYDASTCWVLGTASNFTTGYGGESFAVDTFHRSGILDRPSTIASFADASFVYVPYCTGDLHTGDGIAMYDVNGAIKPTYHFGGHNIDVVINALAATYKAIDRMWIAGSSAGGYGTVLNQDFFARGLHTKVDVIDDSGPALSLPFGGATTPPTSWSSRLPPTCTSCDSLLTIAAFDRATYPTSRFAFLSFQTDTVLPFFYGVTPVSFASTLVTYESSLTVDANQKSFVAAGLGHQVLVSTGNETLDASVKTWLTAMTTDDPNWVSVAP